MGNIQSTLSVFTTQISKHQRKLQGTFLSTFALVLLLRRRGITLSSLYATTTVLFRQGMNTIEKNQFLQAMLYPSAIGLVYYWFQQYVWNELRSRFKRLFYCSISITSKDENFKPILDFVAKCSQKGQTLLVAETKKKKNDRKAWRRRWNGIGERAPPELEYRPAKSGAMTTFVYDGTEMYLWRTRGKSRLIFVILKKFAFLFVCLLLFVVWLFGCVR